MDGSLRNDLAECKRKLDLGWLAQIRVIFPYMSRNRKLISGSAVNNVRASSCVILLSIFVTSWSHNDCW